MSVSHDDILLAAVPGEEFTPQARLHITGSRVERPRKYWRSPDRKWAVYTVTGGRLGDTIIRSVQKAKGKGLIPLLVVRDNTEFAAVAERYGDLECHVACPIAGRGALIPPISVPRQRPRRRSCSTRIPPDLLGELADVADLPRSIGSALRRLRDVYQQMPDVDALDEAEHSALMSFLKGVLRQMGFRNTGNDSPGMIRRLEIAGWGGRRDHFFHSFQNFFFGLYAVARLHPHFSTYRDTARLYWDVEPYDVWLLAALWHDVGYGISQLEAINDDVMGRDVAETVAEYSRAAFLNNALSQEALLKICTLMARLLKPEAARTGYMPPDAWPKRNKTVAAIRDAFEDSIMDHGHGAPSALRLYSDFMPAVRRLGQARQDVLTQAVQLACVSLPFHDSNFRDHLRLFLGPFAIDTTVMPFAALLAFVDSIQDDRRDLDGVKEEMRFLERILVQHPATVVAEVNGRSLPVQSILWKVVEARDVLLHLCQDPACLCFRYPTWMVPA